MKRLYKDGEHDDVVYYTGLNMEKTLAYGKPTLFVQQMRPAKIIMDIAEDRNCTHIYLGAQGTFRPQSPKEWNEYDELVEELTSNGFLVTVEHDLKYSRYFLEGGFVENNMCIPVLSITVPYLEQYRYNGAVKFNDSSFAGTNAGIWVHDVQSVTSKESFTHWSEYFEGDLPV